MEKPTQTGDANFLEILRAINKKMEDSQKNNESLTKNIESMNKKMDDSL